MAIDVWLGGYVVLFDSHEHRLTPGKELSDIHHALLNLPQAHSVHGPLITGVTAVTFEVGDLPLETLIENVRGAVVALMD